MPDYSYPQWLIPRHSPWEALVAGVGAGAQIAANNQRGRALASEAQHRAFQDEVLHQKFQADTQDLQTLQAWWPTFANAEGEALQTLQVPPLKNAQMWNRINIALGEKRQQAAASELANAAANLNFTDPADVATWYQMGSRAMQSGLKMDIKDLQAPVFKAQELKRLEDAQRSLADWRMRGTVVEQNINRATELERGADEIEAEFPDEADKMRLNAKQLRESVPSHAYGTLEGPVTESPVVDKEGNVNPDFFATPSATGRGWTVHRKTQRTATLTPTAESGIIKSQIADVEKELDALPGAGTVGEKSRGTEKRRLELEAKRDKLRADRDALRHPAEAAAPTNLPTATNPATGERIIYKDGKWQPLK